MCLEISVDRRVQSKHLLSFADPLPAGVVQMQSFNRSPADRRQSLNFIAVDVEVFSPKLPDRAEQSYFVASLRIERCNPGRFVEIASWTRQRQILQIRSSTVAMRDDVLDMKGSALQGFVHAAVLTAGLGAGPYYAGEVFGYSRLWPLAENLQSGAAHQRQPLAQLHQRLKLFLLGGRQKALVVAVHQVLKTVIGLRRKMQFPYRLNPIHRRCNCCAHSHIIRWPCARVNGGCGGPPGSIAPPRGTKRSKYPPAEPGALDCEPLKAARQGR
jgi:hypothetical protein